MVRNQGLDVDGGTVCNVTILGKPPWYVERMPGGVRGGGRKASAYSITALCATVAETSNRKHLY
ncbi:MAG TPA: hypothetical protein QGG18_10180, partial [Rhodospirillales bacterium]|nr:hypothetical protein [Rhodospirillales bacterium]